MSERNGTTKGWLPVVSVVVFLAFVGMLGVVLVSVLGPELTAILGILVGSSLTTVLDETGS